MRAIEREYVIASMAHDALLEALAENPSLLVDRRVNQIDFISFKGNLELTYLIRLFAEFETGLRDCWKNRSSRKTKPGTKDLIDSLGSKHKILNTLTLKAHSVRDYRNTLVHEEDTAEASPPVNLRDARGYLCRFFSHLPENW